MNIYSQLLKVLRGKEGKIFTTSELKNILHGNFQTNKTSVIPSDYCYNRINEGIKFNKHLFVMLNRGEYKFIGKNVSYSGRIYKKPKGLGREIIAGAWKDGKYKLWNPSGKNIKYKITPNSQGNIHALNIDEIQKLYEEYMELLELEINVFGVKPTETRHLIGRIGEFKCALITKGTLTHVVNQKGFDVISNNKNISVKTTAQKTGFVSVNKKTLEHVDDLMILQYNNNELKVIYYGDIKSAIALARPFKDRFEIDLTKAKKLESYKL